MVKFSKIEWDNGRGFLEEQQISSLHYEASIIGGIPSLTFTVSNAQRNNPVIEAGSETTGTTGTPTTLTDTTADFVDASITIGDIVKNTSDSDALWEVVEVLTTTTMTVRLLESGGGDDNIANSDAYEVYKRNRLNIFLPKETLIRMTGRDIQKVIFVGKVIDAISDDDNTGLGENLEVVCQGFDAELLQGQSFVSHTGSVQARSEIVRLGTTERFDGGGTGLLAFPHISSFEGRDGIQHSMNLQTIGPDLDKASRTQLAELLDISKEDQWATSAFLEPSAPFLENTTRDGFEELVYPSAQGNLAQSFVPASHLLLGKVGLHLERVEGTGDGTLTGAIYVRIEANDANGELGTGGARGDVPSGELVTPWSESLLLNISNLIKDTAGQLDYFVFEQPIALSKGSKYWITLQYQENISDNHVYTAATDYVSWHDDSTASLSGSGEKALYTGGIWVPDTTDDFTFELLEYTDAYYYYDYSAGAYEDQTTEVVSAAGSHGMFMDDLNAAVNGAVGDRLYIRSAGPVRGYDFLIDVASNVEHGTIQVKYYGGTQPKITGRHTGSDNQATTLTDSDKEFRLTSVEVGDILHNISDGSWGEITVITGTTLTVGDLLGGVENDFDTGDLYEVVNLAQVDSGTATSGSATQMVDSGGSFIADGVREGDIIVNTTDNLVGVIILITATAIDTATGMSWGASDNYVIYSRWRLLTLKDTGFSTVIVGTHRLEWEIPSDWEAIRLEAGMPEAVAPGFTDVGDMFGFWISIMTTVAPSTAAEVERITPLPGHGYSLFVSPRTHDDVILATGDHDTGGGGTSNDSTLVDVGVDFIATHGILIGDVIHNITDGSQGIITSIVTAVANSTTTNDTLVATLAGGSGNDWDHGDVYVIRRSRQRLSYFRNGSRPLNGPSLEGLTLRCDGPQSDQVWPIRNPRFGVAHRSACNRVRVIGRTTGGATVEAIVDDLASQRALKEVIVKTVVDYSLKSSAQCTDRANAEIAKFSFPANRGIVRVFQFPYHVRVIRRPAFAESGALLQAELDGEVHPTYTHDGGASDAALQDTNMNFKKWGVEPGDLLTNLFNSATAVVTAVATTTNENDTIQGTLSSGSWDNDEKYRVDRREYMQVGDLVRIKCEDPTFIDDDYLVVTIEYEEPAFLFSVRLSKNLQSPTLEDIQTDVELLAIMQDKTAMAAQFAGL